MTLLLGGGSRPGLRLGEATNALLSSCDGPLRLNIGCPFVSRAGIELLALPIAPSTWEKAEKRWIVGLHQGITEPAALRDILNLGNSSARIFAGGPKLDTRALLGTPIFHAKMLALESGSGNARRLTGALVSSANLTRAALGDHAPTCNFEAGAQIQNISATEATAWREWWLDAWKIGLPLTAELIDHYDRLRDGFLRRNPDVEALLDPPSLAQLETAEGFWIEAGAMSGGSRNQVEFSEDLASFFGPPATKSRKLKILYGKLSRNDRPLSPKVTTFNVPIWRLSLPTATQGGPIYPGNIICFERVPAESGYRIMVAPPDSSLARRWHRKAKQTGYLGRTNGNRAFGLF